MTAQKKLNEPSDSLEELKKKIDQLNIVIKTLSKVRPALWEIVSSLAQIHTALGEALIEGYKDDKGFSLTAKNGVTRHSSASKALLDVLEKRMKKFGVKKVKEWDTRLDTLLKPYLFLFNGKA